MIATCSNSIDRDQEDDRIPAAGLENQNLCQKSFHQQKTEFCFTAGINSEANSTRYKNLTWITNIIRMTYIYSNIIL